MFCTAALAKERPEKQEKKKKKNPILIRVVRPFSSQVFELRSQSDVSQGFTLFFRRKKNLQRQRVNDGILDYVEKKNKFIIDQWPALCLVFICNMKRICGEF